MRAAVCRRAGAAMLLATFVLLGAGACEGGGGDGTSLPSDRPSADRTVTRPTDDTQETPRPTDDRTGRPTRTEDATPTARPTEAPPTTAQPAPTTGQPRPEPTRAQPTTQPTQAPEQPPDTAQAAPPAQTPVQPATTPPAASDVAAESTGSGDIWCLLLILMIGLLVGGLVLWRTQNRGDWDTEATNLVGVTTAVLNRMPPTLTTVTAGERALTWPPLRDDLGGLMGSWDVLASRTTDEERRRWAFEIRTLLQDLVDAVDQENEVLAADREWRLLRPRVIAAQEALAAALTARPRPGTPAPSMAGQPAQPGAAGYGATPYVPTGQPTGPDDYTEPGGYDDPAGPAGPSARPTYPPRHAAPPPGPPQPGSRPPGPPQPRRPQPGPPDRSAYPPEPPDPPGHGDEPPPGYGDGPPFTSRG